MPALALIGAMVFFYLWSQGKLDWWRVLEAIAVGIFLLLLSSSPVS